MSGTAKDNRRRIGLREVRSIGPGEMMWDMAVGGFGIRRQQSPMVSYILFYRTLEGRQRWITIGRHGSPWSPDDARAEARRLLGEVARGADPAADRRAQRVGGGFTISDLCDRYLADAESGRLLTRLRRPKKATTLGTDRSRIAAHIKPMMGNIPVTAVTREDVERLLHGVTEGITHRRLKLPKRHALSHVRGGKGAAARTIGLLGAMMTYAVSLKLRADNPVHGILRPADGRREHRLRDEDYVRLHEALIGAEASGVWAPGIGAIRFLLLTGWRRGEALELRWSEIDLARRTAHLGDTKTGRSMRPLTEAVCTMLRAMPRQGEIVFPAPSGDRPMQGFRRIWTKVVNTMAGLPTKVTPHVFRHSYASVAADLGLSDATIAGLLGHAGHSVTRRYIHSADATLLAAADRVATEIMVLMQRPMVMLDPVSESSGHGRPS